MSLDSPLLSGGSPRITLQSIYDAISDRFVNGGVEESVMADFRQRCRVDGEAAEPLRYDALEPPYPPGAVRLAILPVVPDGEQRELIEDATAAVHAALPKGADFASYINAPEHWHITLFHTARLGDARPDAFAADGGVRTSLEGPAAQRPPSEAELAREVEAFGAQAQKFQPLTLQVYRLVMADSGVLLLCCLDLSDQVPQLRGLLKAALPGAPAQQTAIMHVSLARMAGGAAGMTPEARRRVQDVCDDWSARLRGMTMVVDQVVHVLEEVFSTVQGSRRTAFRLAQGLPELQGTIAEE